VVNTKNECLQVPAVQGHPVGAFGRTGGSNQNWRLTN